MTLQTFALLTFSLFQWGIFFRALQRCRAGHFYQDTFFLIPLGIFVWGDALVMAPFWAVTSLVGLWQVPLTLFRFVLFFYLVRSAYEVVYWINHQVAQRDYTPPLFKNVAWLQPNEAAILYQLINMVQVIISGALLGWTYTH